MSFWLGHRHVKVVAASALVVMLGACSTFNRDTITTTGEITDQGQECVTFRANDGTLYALANKASGFRPGDLVRVTGHSALMTTCREASTLIVDKITMLAPAKTGQ
ncbi:DUF5818 domain-containing protein [Thalassospira sp. MCCC 1A01428]|jgi:hypothetical protein|uniref:DUF5818 domain-containing protein n=1 Tax=Thalassospira sp. MCCC 1A01428 TaxID=1470575 RepID=UPI000A1E68EF|nr:DUF5818 domain-containing protein [Thalassospira sp. MCCC 1A01428]OSQ39952.1 hypothetical protein THS27_20955 [Thalassospira sp. MCCC 1A01428]